jgi:pimeloyl-ACP methyl ester carboxylesterase
MRTLIAAAMAGAVFMGSALPAWAQSVVGTWQGTYTIPGASLKEVIKITQGPDGKLHGEAFHPGPELAGSRNGNPISTVEVQGRHVRLVMDDSLTRIDADLSADGQSLTGASVLSGITGVQTLPITFDRATDKSAWPLDPSPHKVRFVEVEKGVRLEVLDWGGQGPALVFVPAPGETAHAFDDFAPRFTTKHHVYAITRRGTGLSSRPEPTDDNYKAERLGEDVLAVVDALKLDRPVIAGHSRAGSELSFFGAHHPERVSGLVYLEAGYDYALFDPKTEAKVQEMSAKRPLAARPGGAPVVTADALSRAQSPQDKVMLAIVRGWEKYPAINGPVLAVFADHAGQPATAAFVDGFEADVPQARVVRIPNAEHYIFRSNPDEVERAMNAFMDGLPKARPGPPHS